jgi:hypothetical protein
MDLRKAVMLRRLPLILGIAAGLAVTRLVRRAG